ncbi:hypothetical protein [Nonomuraea typhae]|uniref:Uncharacterized protein n=1 Tax=Nonomuraea typhae TaxID=2603600 RepID=A0ABW7YJ49_9ACTN
MSIFEMDAFGADHAEDGQQLFVAELGKVPCVENFGGFVKGHDLIDDVAMFPLVQWWPLSLCRHVDGGVWLA